MLIFSLAIIKKKKIICIVIKAIYIKNNGIFYNIILI